MAFVAQLQTAELISVEEVLCVKLKEKKKIAMFLISW